MLLRDLQASFAAHLAGGAAPALEGAVVGDSIPAAARLRVYRHHVQESLAAALAATFPTVKALVGADFFRGLALAFVARSLPEQPVLTEYGAGFADFIANWEPARGLPYLADVAGLDWALNVAFHAPAAAPLDLTGMAPERLPALVLALAPGTVVLRSSWPLDRIWTAAQPGAPDGTVDLDGGGVALLVLRRPDDAAFAALTPGEAAFVTCVQEGDSLEQAALASAAAEPGLNLSSGFARLLALGAFAAVQ